MANVAYHRVSNDNGHTGVINPNEGLTGLVEPAINNLHPNIFSTAPENPVIQSTQLVEVGYMKSHEEYITLRPESPGGSISLIPWLKKGHGAIAIGSNYGQRIAAVGYGTGQTVVCLISTLKPVDGILIHPVARASSVTINGLVQGTDPGIYINIALSACIHGNKGHEQHH